MHVPINSMSRRGPAGIAAKFFYVTRMGQAEWITMELGKLEKISRILNLNEQCELSLINFLDVDTLFPDQNKCEEWVDLFNN